MDYHLLFYRSCIGKKDILTSSETYIGTALGRTAFCVHSTFVIRCYELVCIFPEMFKTA